MELFAAAKKLGFAIPAVNVTSSSTANAVMEAAASINSPIILQVMVTFGFDFMTGFLLRRSTFFCVHP